MMSVRTRLGTMMFLEYAIYGAWLPVLSEYLINTLRFTGMQAGIILSLLPLATIVSPFIFAQFADRYVATERLIAALQLAGAALLFVMSGVTGFGGMKWLMLAYSLLFAPTFALTNSLAFIHLTNSEKEFGKVRVWGTIGWIAAGLALAGWRYVSRSIGMFEYPGDTLFLAGVFSLLMAVQALTLPHTPPPDNPESPWAFLEAAGMLRNRNFLVFMLVAFVVTGELVFYDILAAPFLTSGGIGIPNTWISGVMTIAQAAEILIMAFLLPWFLPRFGIKNTLLVGIFAGALRYGVFALGGPVWLVIAALTLQGFCYAFFYIAACIHVDEIAPPDIRASAQSLINLVTIGAGSFLGSLATGWVADSFTAAGASGSIIQWPHVFAIPAGAAILCFAALALFFRNPARKKAN
jgi:nucleoside transporter